MTSQLNQIASKFRGTLLGGLIGDCLGAPFEGEFPITKSVLTKYLQKQIDPNVTKGFQIFPYTDDTAMARVLSESLIANKGLNEFDLARRFTNEYFQQPKRGYGSNVVDVFAALRYDDFKNPYEPARMQFGGSGSYGNGAAMRVAPVALFAFSKSDEEVIELAKNSARITHSHVNGYNGAILQCLAIHQALHLTVSDLNPIAFLDNLIVKMSILEKSQELSSNNSTFTQKLKTMKEIIENTAQGADITPEEVAVLFGNGVAALKSVPTAIFSFLRALNQVKDFDDKNPFVRTLYFSLACGGDTDTIACMALSIAGALYGTEGIPDVLVKHCEDASRIFNCADQLYDLNENGN